MIVLSEKDIAALLPMETAIDVIERAMIAVSAGKATLPLRSTMEAGGSNRMGIMPGAMRDPVCHGVKLVSLFPDNPAAGYSSHQGAIVLFEPKHGSAVAMMNAGLLTAIRTAAASAVATRVLAREDSKVLAVIGTGEQAEHHLDAMMAVRAIAEIRIVGRHAEKAAAFVERARLRFPALSFGSGTDVRAAVGGADIVCTVTSAAEPILFGDWIAPGTHINVVGASIPSKREIDAALVAGSALYVDYRPSTFAQAGEVIEAMDKGLVTRDHVRAEIGEVLAGAAPGRGGRDEITLYRSLGIAAQDLACAHHCLLAARERGLGVDVEL
ncbi:MAG: ornithine cyclodeaminase [Rhizobiales bacterium 65-79]|nr:ornithine cyclodeaminase family protein [Hyphomicrobiales bacterium]OJU04744.1 MAG: ornithine cyclodeaminase [Rhizobiales bacterium 65-79]